MLVDVAEDGIALQKRRQATAGARYFEAGVDRIGKIAGVAQHVAGRHGRRVRGGEGWKQRVAVAQADAAARDRRHGRGGAFVHHAEPQAVGDIKHHVVGLRRRRLRKSSTHQGKLQDCRTEQKRQTHGEAPCMQSGESTVF